MIKLTTIPIDQLKDIIAYSFEGDNDLLNTYHISPGTLSHCVSHTFGFIEKNKDFYGSDWHCYRIDCIDCVEGDGAAIGYTVTITNAELPNELYSFGIRKEFRKKEILQKWLAEVEKTIGIPYYLVVWTKNTRAVEFFIKNGFYQQDHNELTKLTNGQMEARTLFVKT